MEQGNIGDHDPRTRESNIDEDHGGLRRGDLVNLLVLRLAPDD